MTSAVFADPIEIQLEDNTTWSGQTDQTITVKIKDGRATKTIEGAITRATEQYIVIDGEIVFVTDIISITSEEGVTVVPTENVTDSDSTDAIDGTAPIIKPIAIAKEGDLPVGVFCLPLHGMVGTYFRDDEIRTLVDHIEENYGLGQIIILEIHSGGGAVHIWDKIRNLIFELRDRHRFVAWIESAGSGAAATAFLCDEIYYRSFGYVGAITMYAGSIENVAPDWQMDGWVRELESVLARTSHTPMIAGSMVRSKNNFSYDIDPETGIFTYYDHEFGDHVLSKTGRNMMLNASEALHCGMSDGTADTGEELAALLDLDEWIEIDQFGRELAAKWTATLDEFENEAFPELRRKFGGDVQGKNAKERITNQIKAGEELLKWAKILGDTGEMLGLSKRAIEQIKRQIKDLEHQRQQIE